MSTDFLLRVVRRSQCLRAELHGELSAQELRNDRWRAIIARVAKACAELTEPCLNDNRAVCTDADASMSDWKLLSLKCYSKDGMSYVRVRALYSIPTFVGLDTHNYSLQRDDVLFIPCANAQVLYARGLVVLAEQFVENTSGDNAHQLHEGEDDSAVIFDAH